MLLGDLESLAVLGAPDLLYLGDGTGGSVIQAYIDFIGVPLVAKDGFKNLDVASLKLLHRAGVQLQVASSAFLFSRKRAAGGSSYHQQPGSPAARIIGDVV